MIVAANVNGGTWFIGLIFTLLAALAWPAGSVFIKTWAELESRSSVKRINGELDQILNFQTSVFLKFSLYFLNQIRTKYCYFELCITSILLVC